MKLNAEKEVTKIVQFIRDYYAKNHLGGVVLGISGGKDSAVAAALFVRALGKENVIGLTLPCHSKEEDRIHAQLISDRYGFSLYHFDLTNVFDRFHEELNQLGFVSQDLCQNSDLNLKPRLRMATVYYFAALMSEIHHQMYLVAGTSNKCELYVGYFTKGGDSVHDIAVLADFTVEEVLALGDFLEVPKEVLYKEPSDGLSNQIDEEKLGVTYQEIASYMVSPQLVEPEHRRKIEALHEKNQHKFVVPTYRKG